MSVPLVMTSVASLLDVLTQRVAIDVPVCQDIREEEGCAQVYVYTVI